MNIYFCNINNINEEVEEFVIAKNKIEKPLIEKEILEKKMSIKDFLEYVDLTKNILIINNEENDAVPFKIYNTKENEIVVIFSSVKQENSDILKNHLKKIEYNFSNLKELSPLDLLEGNINNEYYIIDNNYYMD